MRQQVLPNFLQSIPNYRCSTIPKSIISVVIDGIAESLASVICINLVVFKKWRTSIAILPTPAKQSEGQVNPSDFTIMRKAHEH